MKNRDILIVGVGGQGVLLASELLSTVAMEAGYDVKKSEVHGMAQRGGVVSSHVRLGKQVFSPLIPEGKADVLLAFEQSEALRWIHFLKPEGAAIINFKKLVPPIALLKGKGPVYPEDPIGDVRKRISRVFVVPAESIAVELENPRIENSVLLGALSCFLEIPAAVWESVIIRRVPKGTEDVNLRAFRSGVDRGGQPDGTREAHDHV
jgi:indolepyruvate ferredoxin oxidoreductase, beta subunit